MYRPEECTMTLMPRSYSQINMAFATEQLDPLHDSIDKIIVRTVTGVVYSKSEELRCFFCLGKAQREILRTCPFMLIRFRYVPPYGLASHREVIACDILSGTKSG